DRRDDEPRRRKPARKARGGGGWVWILLLVGGIVGVCVGLPACCGVGAWIYGPHELKSRGHLMFADSWGALARDQRAPPAGPGGRGGGGQGRVVGPVGPVEAEADAQPRRAVEGAGEETARDDPRAEAGDQRQVQGPGPGGRRPVAWRDLPAGQRPVRSEVPERHVGGDEGDRAEGQQEPVRVVTPPGVKIGPPAERKVLCEGAGVNREEEHGSAALSPRRRAAPRGRPRTRRPPPSFFPVSPVSPAVRHSPRKPSAPRAA